MKKIIIAICAVAALGLVSCSKEIGVSENKKDAPVVNQDPAALRLFANTGATVDPEAEKEDADSKSKITASNGEAANNVVKWESGDKIAVFAADGTAVPFTTSSTTSSGTFVEDVTGSFQSETDGVYAFYPYDAVESIADGVITATVPVEQGYTKQSFAKGANLSIAKMSEGSLNFKNVCGYIRFVNPNNSYITKIVIKSNGGESLAGKVNISYNNGNPVCTVTEGVDSIVVAGTAAFAKATAFYVTLLPGTYDQGLTIKVIHGSITVGTAVCRVGNVVKNTHTLEILRNTVLRVRNGDWDKHLNKAIDPIVVLNGEEGKSDMNANTAGAKWSDYIDRFGSERTYYTPVATPDALKNGNNSAHVIRCGAKYDDAAIYPKQTSTSNVDNCRMMPYFNKVTSSVTVDGTTTAPEFNKCFTYFNAVRFKMWVGDDIIYPRVQWGLSDITATSSSALYVEGDTNFNRPICTPSYVNGTKLAVKLIRFGTTKDDDESITNLNGDFNVIDDAWLNAYAGAIKKNAWNEFTYSITDLRGSGNIGTGLSYVRIHPYVPCDKANSIAYRPESYSVCYLDDLQVLYVK